MDINTFYELRTRLYATAAAGCGLIEEDFRLKRAIEAFQPMAAANKVFGRFYQMCMSLFTTENVAGTLVDCIALADALAVTQGSFQDNSECVEGCKEKNEIKLQPQKMLHSTLQDLIDRLTADKRKECKYNKNDTERILDPRIFPIFIDSLIKKDRALEEIAEVIFPKLGDGVIDLLKEKINYEDTSAKNKTAYYVRLISKFYGEKENDWYVSLVENEENPKSIRIEAVEALGCSMENAQKLAELYKTQKAAIKNQVLWVLAKLNPPEAEDIWKKLIEKYKESNDKYIYASKSDICAEFVRKRFLEKMESWEEAYQKAKNGEKLSLIHQYTNREEITCMLGRKYQFSDCFCMIADKLEMMRNVKKNLTKEEYVVWKADINQVLILNLMEKEQEYETLVKEVYEAHKDFYFPARFFLALKELKEEAFEVFQEEIRLYRYDTLQVLGNIRYNRIQEKYLLEWNHPACYEGFNTWDESRICAFESIPESYFSYLTETDYIENPANRMPKFQIQYTLNRTLWILDPAMLGLEENSREYERCKQTLISFAFQINKVYSIGNEIDRIERYYMNGDSSEYRGLVTNYVMGVVSQGRFSSWELRYLDRFPMTQGEKQAELIDLKKKVSQMSEIKQGLREDVIKVIDMKLQRIQND
ncbi:MAG: hypothetical protein IJA36_13220 [Lachnospiraceae bacterium]|nr:hypothetical protein [Lachnospiraceae bacterium]